MTEDIHLRHCTKCKTVSNLGQKGYAKKTTNGVTRHYYMCNPCNTARHRKYRKTDSGDAAYKAAAYKSMKKHKQKQRARDMVRYYLNKGTITRPDECSRCSEPCKTDAHHINYDSPLEVTWLCRLCHIGVHKRGYKLSI